MKRSNYDAPTKYGGPRDNKRAIGELSDKCFGLSAMVSANRPAVERRLERIGTSLKIKASVAGHKAFIFANVINIDEDLAGLRSALCEGNNKGEVDHYLKSLEADIDVLGTFLEHEIGNSPMEANMSRAVRKFIIKKSAVEAIARATESSLSNAENELRRLTREAVNNEHEARCHEQRIVSLKSLIKGRQSAAQALDSIVIRLNQLIDTARLSPGLARRLNRLIRLKPLADFYDKPIHSQKERETLYLHLYYLIQNQTDAGGSTDKLDNFLNNVGLKEASELPIESQTAPEVVATSEQELVEEQPQIKSQKQNIIIGGIQQ